MVGNVHTTDGLRTHVTTNQANYFCRRKFLLVNGTHTTLAFMTLCLRQPRQTPNEVGTRLYGVNVCIYLCHGQIPVIRNPPPPHLTIPLCIYKNRRRQCRGTTRSSRGTRKPAGRSTTRRSGHGCVALRAWVWVCFVCLVWV
jgi:hypothetical protein